MNSNINIYLGVWLQSLPASLLSVKEQSFSRWEPSPPARNIVSLGWKRILLSLAIDRLSLLILAVLIFWKKVLSKALSGWTSRPHRCGFSHCWSVAVHRGTSTQSTSVNTSSTASLKYMHPERNTQIILYFNRASLWHKILQNCLQEEQTRTKILSQVLDLLYANFHTDEPMSKTLKIFDGGDFVGFLLSVNISAVLGD